MRTFKSKTLLIKTFMLIILFGLVSHNGMAQELSKKELKQKEETSKKEATAALLESKTYIFKGRTAIANGGRTVDLIDNPNFIKFSPDMVVSEMPFFGQATSASFYGSDDAGLYFKGKPEKYNIDENKKNFRIRMEVKDTNDTYRINLSVSNDGNSTITITSNRKSVMTYYGRLSKD